MYTQSLTPSFFSRQPSVKGSDLTGHHSKRHEGVEDRHNKHQNINESRQVADPHRVDKVNSTMAVQSVATSTRHSAEIQVTTQEGDVVTISLNEAISSSRAGFAMKQGNSKITAYSETSTTESGFSLSIDGDLNKKEEKALAKLIDKMAKVSEKFFGGDVEAAFKHAEKIGFDNKQIAGFSMDLNKQTSVQTVAAYQQTAMLDQNINTDMLKEAREFLAETKDFMAGTASLLDSFAEPKQAFGDLFAGVGQMYQKEEPEEVTSDSLFLSMIENIVDEMFTEIDEARI